MPIPVVDVYGEILEIERAPTKQILIPVLEGSGNCNKLPDSSTYRIVSTGADFPDKLIGSTVTIVASGGASISVVLQECATKTLAKRALDFEFLGDSKKIDRHRASIYLMEPHDIYSYNNLETRHKLLYTRAMENILQLQDRQNPTGACVKLADVLDDLTGYWQNVVEGVLPAPKTGRRGELITDDQVLVEAQRMERVKREVLIPLHKIIEEEEFFRPISDEEFAIQLRHFRLNGIAGLRGSPINEVDESLDDGGVLKLWNNTVALFDEPEHEELIIEESTTEAEVEQKKIDIVGVPIAESENKSPVSSAELSEAEVTQLVSAVA